MAPEKAAVPGTVAARGGAPPGPEPVAPSRARESVTAALQPLHRVGGRKKVA